MAGFLGSFRKPIQEKPSLVTELAGGLVVPGFVDLQVNGGGGIMFNDDPCVATLELLAKTHAGLGATSILPTLVTDSLETTSAAIEAALAATETGVTGILGLHLEGAPHLSEARKGAHDASFIRPMSREDEDALCKAAQCLPILKVTVAPEAVSKRANQTPHRIRSPRISGP